MYSNFKLTTETLELKYKYNISMSKESQEVKAEDVPIAGKAQPVFIDVHLSHRQTYPATCVCVWC